MARVYRAVDTRLDRVVAIKILREQFTEPEFITRFRQEARLAAGLAHPNIVGVYDVGVEHGLHYMVMEYVEGENLKQVIAREAPMPIETVIPFVRQLCAALDYAHDHGVIHRDIKPENILITPRRELKVGDFGIARALASSGLTATGTILGSVSYFSPEQASGQPPIAESDLYSAGMVLYEMLTRQVPFAGPNPVAVAMAQVNDPPPSPRTFRPDLSPAVAAVVLKAIAKKPADRFHSGYEMVTALVAPTAQRAVPAPKLTVDFTTMSNAPTVMAAVPQRPRRQGTGGALVALLTTAALLIGAVLVGRSLTSSNSASGTTPTATVAPAAVVPTATRAAGAAAGASSTPHTTATSLAGAGSPVADTPTTVPATVAPTSVPTVHSVPGVTTPITVAGTATVPPATNTPGESATPGDTATPATTATPANTATLADTATPAGPKATLGPTNGATVDLVTAPKMGKHFVAVDPTTSFSSKTQVVYAVALIHHKAQGASVLFMWHYPDGSTFPYLNDVIAPYTGDIRAYAELELRGPGTYSVTASINGHQLAEVMFSVGAGDGSASNGNNGDQGNGNKGKKNKGDQGNGG